MFYKEKRDNALRFGDVLVKYILASSNIKEPVYNDFNINIEFPAFCVVLSPCCSIGEKIISLSPLVKIRKDFFKNPYFRADMTRINSKMLPEESLSTEKWDKLPEAEKQRRKAIGLEYALLEFFIYEQNTSFTPYTETIRGEEITTSYYMIDFRKIYRVNCDKIMSATDAPIETKILQLDEFSRKDLREKLANYFFRTAEEDKPYLGE